MRRSIHSERNAEWQKCGHSRRCHYGAVKLKMDRAQEHAERIHNVA